MLKTAFTTALVVCSLAIATPGMAGPSEDLAQRCADAGGSMRDGKCFYPDGSVEGCFVQGDDAICMKTEPERSRTDQFHTLINVPKKVVKKPIPHGPMTMLDTGTAKKARVSENHGQMVQLSKSTTVRMTTTAKAKVLTSVKSAPHALRQAH